MNKKQKTILIIGILVFIAIIVTIIIVKKSKKVATKTELVKAIDISQAIDIENIDTLEKDKIKDVQVASKYITGKETYKLKARVNFDDISGDMIYVRENDEKLNIFQATYKINKYENINMQIQQDMNEFERMCTQYIGVDMDIEKEGTLYGESTSKGMIPVEESIYDEERLYSKTYTVKKEDSEETYDINFYKKDNNLIAEFVRILD